MNADEQKGSPLISSYPPLNTSPLLMSGFQLKVTLLRKGDVMLLWSDTVALMFLFCQAVTKTKVASVCPGVVQSCIAPSPRNHQMRSNNKNSLLDCVPFCVSPWNLTPPSLSSVLLTHNPWLTPDLRTGEFHLHNNTDGCVRWHVLLQWLLEPPGSTAGDCFSACTLVLLLLGGDTYNLSTKLQL